MKNKGFTLVELLGVIVVLGIVSILAISKITNVQKKSKEKLYDEQINRIESSAKLWAINNNIELYENDFYKVNLDRLIESNFLDKNNIVNPIDNSEIGGCVNIRYELGEYSYTYDKTCGLMTYTLTYNLNGGMLEKENPKYYTNETETFFLNNPIKKGNLFLGWTGTNLDTTTKDVTISKGSSGNREYTANFERVKYSITYNLNGGMEYSNPTEYYVDTPTIYLNRPIKVGYNFLGWTGTSLSLQTMDVIIPRGSTDNRTYSANWAIGTYQLAIEPNGGIWNESTDNRIYNMQYNSTKVIENPQREGYIFTGWKLIGNNSSLDGTTFTMGNANATLTAQWAKLSYRLTLVANGGNWNGSTSNRTYELAYGDSKTLEIPTKEGYAFYDWTPSVNSGILNNNSFTMGNEDVTLTANWIDATTEFAYTGTIQEYIVPVTGYYQLTVWGAQGGDTTFVKNNNLCNSAYDSDGLSISSKRIASGGRGGESMGFYYATAGEKLYVVVGGRGAGRHFKCTNYYGIYCSGLCYNHKGYNGGGFKANGSGYEPTTGGGGATHIAKTTGLLSTLSSDKSSLLIAAGGGGGSYWHNQNDFRKSGGSGGGLTGGSSDKTDVGYAWGTGGKQKQATNSFLGPNWTGDADKQADVNNYYVGTFGKGGTANAGGGGGYYGGGAGTGGGAGGGSGYIDGVTSYNDIVPITENNKRRGDGYATITFISR